MSAHRPSIERIDDELDLVTRLLPVAKPCRVIELGCGAAALARALVARSVHCTVTALEVDQVQMAINLSAPLERLSFIEAGAQSIPFDDGTFDCALMLKSLHHVPMPLMGQALREVARVLRPAGRLYVSEPTYGGAFNDIVRLFNDEGMVRAAAQGALDAALVEHPLLWQQVDEIRFTMPARYSGFDELSVSTCASYADHALDDTKIAQVRAALKRMSVLTVRGSTGCTMCACSRAPKSHWSEFTITIHQLRNRFADVDQAHDHRLLRSPVCKKVCLAHPVDETARIRSGLTHVLQIVSLAC